MPITLAYVGQIGQDVIESLKNRQNTGKKGQKRRINTSWTQSKTKDLILRFLLSHWLRVRIPPRSQKTPEKQGFFSRKDELTESQVHQRYANHDSTLRPN